MNHPTIVPVILSGGSGTRLWPVSRIAKPKQMQRLAGAATMLQLTAERVAGLPGFADPIVIAGRDHGDEVSRQMAAAGAEARLILEPMGRNTAAAIALAALECDPQELLLVMPSDQLIGRPEVFRDAIGQAAGAAIDDWIVTFGITPDRPETGFGYIRLGAEIEDGVCQVEGFVEKPQRAVAERYLAEGGYAWNGGIFLFRAGRMVDALEAHAPDILSGVRAARAAADRGAGPLAPDAALFAAVRSQSIDHAVMEADARIAVVPVDMGWSDVGSWDALYEIGQKDARANVADGAAVLHDTSGTFVRSDGPLVVASGLEDMIVVATADVVMILPRGQSQRVKDARDLLLDRPELL